MIAIDLFAGGGGFTTGASWAGARVIAAVNHDPAAIEMHAANHPDADHRCESVFDVDPRDYLGRSVELLLASPDCTHHSRAKGGKPRDTGLRALAWVVVKWADVLRPRRIIVENVPEFVSWGPLDERGQPIDRKEGEEFRAWVQALRALGYAVDWRVLNAADYGAPTSRKRLFVVASRDGAPRWPMPTHGPGRQLPWRTAAECIDWSHPCPSIFGRVRPLKPATERRIAEGIRRYVLTAARPYIVPVKTWGGGGNGPRNIDAPMPTITTSKRGEYAVVAPSIVAVTHRGDDRVHRPDEPLRTITTANGGEFAVCAPTLVQTGYGEREGQSPRVLDLDSPLGTVVAGGAKHAVAAAFLAKHFGGMVGHGVDRPLGTVTAVDHHSLVAAELGQNAPNAAKVAAFLVAYYGSGSQWQGLDEPLRTIVSKARFGLVTVTIDGTEYVITDIGMRMLQPRELATAQGFGPETVLTGSKAAQIARIGNSVSPPVAEALVRAQFDAQAPTIREEQPGLFGVAA